MELMRFSKTDNKLYVWCGAVRCGVYRYWIQKMWPSVCSNSTRGKGPCECFTSTADSPPRSAIEPLSCVRRSKFEREGHQGERHGYV